MANVKQLWSMADIDQILAWSAKTPVLVFKHSTRCPISARAYQEWQRFLMTPEAQRIGHAFVRVIEERPVARAVGDRVAVAHASPQAILIVNGRAIWAQTHGGITADSLRRAATARV